VFALQDVTLEDFDSLRIAESIQKKGVQVPVELDTDQSSDFPAQQIGQATGSAAHFEDYVRRVELCLIREATHQIAIDQKVLAKSPLGAQAGRVKSGPDLAQRLNVLGAQIPSFLAGFGLFNFSVYRTTGHSGVGGPWL
jgi:hypothetical protein